MRTKQIVQKKSKEDLIHVRLESEELIEAKKDILNTESDLIEIIQIIKRYQQIRMNELKLKNRLYERLKLTNKELRKLDDLLPKQSYSKDLSKPEEKKEEQEFKVSPAFKPKKDPLELQLEEIQRKLRSLE